MTKIKKILFWFVVVLVALLVMRPASAQGSVASKQLWSPYVAGAEFYSGPSSCADYARVQANSWPYGTSTYDGETVVTRDALGNPIAYNCRARGADGSISYSQTQLTGYKCPSNTTKDLAGQCICNTGFEPNALGTECVSGPPPPPPPPTCPAANTVAASGLFDYGTDQNRLAAGLLNGCGANNCETIVGTLDPISKSGLVGGVRHYFGVGVLVFSGNTCKAGAPAVPNTTSPTITQTCGPGESAVTGANNYFACYKDGVNTASSAVPVTTTTRTTSTTIDPTTGQPVTTVTDTTTETLKSPADIYVPGATPAPTTPACDPADPACVPAPQPTATVAAQPLDGLYNGDLNAAGHKTVGDVVGSFKTRVLNAPVGAAVSGFFNVQIAGGTCPVWTADIPMFGVMTFDFFCAPWLTAMWPWIRGVIMIIFSYAAFRIAVL